MVIAVKGFLGSWGDPLSIMNSVGLGLGELRRWRDKIWPEEWGKVV